MRFTPLLLKRALGLIFLLLAILWLYSTKIDTFARTLNINNYSECPPQSDKIWVQISAAYSPTGTEIVRQIPFDSGTQWYQEWIPNLQTPDPNDGEWRWIEYDNYLRGVLGGEVGIEGYFDEDALRAMAILARTKAYERCGAFIVNNHRGILGQSVQEYRYHQVLDFNNPQIYQNAVDYGNNPYITYNNDTFDVQYRDKGGKWTEEMGGPHIKIYDPPGERYYQNPTNPPIPWTGLMQENANIWAKGVGSDGYKFPPWDVPRLLAHSYGSIEFVGLNPTPPNDYRFNILRFGGMDDQANNPLILRTGETYPFSFIIQNTGGNTWSLNCYSAYPWHDTALSFHWYSYPDKQYLSPQTPYFEGPRTALCSSPLPPGKENKFEGWWIDDIMIEVSTPPLFLPETGSKQGHSQ
ncbi:MAG: hypothetical protein D6732_04440 [Methanobacteriota archaeon]|nr:MAG: hypothetical protein D6732_04440 [Euryarchaeota archaeon]